MKEVSHKWVGYAQGLTPKYVVAILRKEGTKVDEIWKLRRNKIHRSESKWLQVGSYLTVRVGRNGNGKSMCTVSVSKKTWTKKELDEVERRAKEFEDVFGT